MWLWECVLYVTLGLVSQVLLLMHGCIVRVLCSVEAMQAEHKVTSEALKLRGAQAPAGTFLMTWVIKRQIKEGVLLVVFLLSASWLMILQSVLSVLSIGSDSANPQPPPGCQQQHATAVPLVHNAHNGHRLCSFERRIADLQLERERLHGQLEEARQQRTQVAAENAAMHDKCSVLALALEGNRKELKNAQVEIAALKAAANDAAQHTQYSVLNAVLEGRPSTLEEVHKEITRMEALAKSSSLEQVIEAWQVPQTWPQRALPPSISKGVESGADVYDRWTYQSPHSSYRAGRPSRAVHGVAAIPVGPG